MPRNHSEKGLKFPTKFPLKGAIWTDVSPKIHERIFWNMGRSMRFSDTELFERIHERYEAVRQSFSDEEERQYAGLPVARAAIRCRSRDWWLAFRRSIHAA